MPRTISGLDGKKYTLPLRFCDEDCNNCEIHQNRQFSLLINILYEKFGEEVYRVTQSVCPNMTCCADCHIDDFCHDRGCEILKEAKAIVRAWYPKRKPKNKREGNDHDNT